jgi:hypothetical protein
MVIGINTLCQCADNDAKIIGEACCDKHKGSDKNGADNMPRFYLFAEKHKTY